MPALSSHRPRLRLRRKTLLGAIVTLICAVVYLAFLGYQDDEARIFYQKLQKENPLRYLEDQRARDGFSNFLESYAKIQGYTQPNPAAPSFLVGRWGLRDAPQRIPPGTVEAKCIRPITFERNLIEMREGNKVEHFDVKYQIKGQKVLAIGPKVGTIQVAVVSYGAAIDHLELIPPGQSKKQYAYLCGN